jgi:hypothetical protein
VPWAENGTSPLIFLTAGRWRRPRQSATGSSRGEPQWQLGDEQGRCGLRVLCRGGHSHALGIRRLYRGNGKPFAEVFIGSTYAMFALAAVLLVSPFVG